MSAIAPTANSPEARTETGEIKDVTTSSATPPTQTETPKETPPSTETKPEAKPDAPEPSLLSEPAKEDDKPKPTEGAPEKYEPFTLPEGFEANPEVMSKAEATFKELGLNQEQSQKLVSFYAEQAKSLMEGPSAQWDNMQAEWARDTRAQFPNIEGVKQNIGKALTTIANGDTTLLANFKYVMDLTGAGNHPAFVGVLNALASAINEGGHVAGRGPSPLGQRGPNSRPQSAAQALYPNLPSAQSQSG